MRRIPVFIAAVAMALTASITFAQTTSGDLVGTVKDPTGAAIANAAVTVTNQATGVVVSIKAGTEGEFRAGNLLPGTYDLAVNSSGFQPYTKPSTDKVCRLRNWTSERRFLDTDFGGNRYHSVQRN